MSIGSVQPGFFTSQQKSYQEFINTYFKNYIEDIGHYASFEVTEKTNLFAQLNDLPFDIDLYLWKIDESTGEPAPSIYNSSTNRNQEQESIFAQLDPGQYWLSLRINHIENQITWPTEEQQLKTFEFKVDGQGLNETTKRSNDLLLNRQWNLFNIDAPKGWKLAHDASDIQIAIIDEGVDVNHPDLIENIWHNPTEITNNGNDDDGNGKTDDIHGWNFITNTPNIVANENRNHGTHVAGIAAAQGNNNIGISGVAWDAQLMTLDVYNGDPQSERRPDFYTHIVPKAIRYAVDNGADIINMSFGKRTKLSSDQYSAQGNIPLAEAFQHAYDNDVFITVAAGNEADPYYDLAKWDGIANLDQYFDLPASFSEIFGNIASVGSTNIQNLKASYSNFGQSISIAAPGGDGPGQETLILSTVPTRTGSIANDYDYMVGTSQAAPLVAGMAALIRAQDAQITATETLAILRAGAQHNPRLMPYVNQGYQANLYSSLMLAQSWEGPDTLTQIGQDIAPIVNLTALTTPQTLTGSLSLNRDTDDDLIIGFYRVLDAKGSVLDASGNLLRPGDNNYQSVALNAGNLVDELTNLEVSNDESKDFDYTLSGSTNGIYLAPYAITGDNTWFAWSEANVDGLDHFQVLGANRFGFEDEAGNEAGGDFNDLVLSFASQQIL